MLGGVGPHRIVLDVSRILCALKLAKIMIIEIMIIEVSNDENIDIFHWVEEQKVYHFEMSDRI